MYIETDKAVLEISGVRMKDNTEIIVYLAGRVEVDTEILYFDSEVERDDFYKIILNQLKRHNNVLKIPTKTN